MTDPEPEVERIVLVACVGKKLDHEAPAQDLYVSDWFKKARAYAERVEREGGRWFILSAKHGLISPFARIEPYDETLADKSRRERERWAEGVRKSLDEIVAGPTELIVLAGKLYRGHWTKRPQDISYWPVTISVPMEGMGIGQQKAFLLAAMKDAAAA